MKITYLVSTETKEQAAKLIANLLLEDLNNNHENPFDFLDYLDRCIELRTRTLQFLSGESKDNYATALSKWKTMNELWQWVELNLLEEKPNNVVRIYGDY